MKLNMFKTVCLGILLGLSTIATPCPVGHGSCVVEEGQGGTVEYWSEDDAPRPQEALLVGEPDAVMYDTSETYALSNEEPSWGNHGPWMEGFESHSAL